MARTKPVLEFRGRMLSLTRVRVLDDEPAEIEAQVRSFVRQLGEAAQGLPVLLDAAGDVNLAGVIASMRAAGLQPIAVLEGPSAASARACGLAVLGEDVVSEGPPKVVPTPQPLPEPEPEPALPREPELRPARIVTEPVRSGQQIYVEGGDLIVTNTVSAGAEVIADGCVHIYGTLRGRAIAGAKGNAAGRIFCRKMEAELLAVAGIYAVAEQIHGTLRGQPVQAFLSGGKLRIERLDA
jgi:septum site-determining protein MinC